jgi:lysophospholipase L1-like esterase
VRLGIAVTNRRLALAASLALLVNTNCLPGPVTFPPAAEFTVATYGDSLTKTEGGGYPAALPPEWQRVNRGVIGEFGIGGAPRLLGNVDLLAANGIDVVVMLWGTNDAYSPYYEANGPTWWRDDLVDKLLLAADALTAAGLPVVLAFPPPNVDPSEQGVLANQRLEELRPLLEAATSARGIPFVDLYGAVAVQPEPAVFFEEDGIHLSPEGKSLVANAIGEAILPHYEGWLAQQVQ